MNNQRDDGYDGFYPLKKDLVIEDVKTPQVRSPGSELATLTPYQVQGKSFETKLL